MLLSCALQSFTNQQKLEISFAGQTRTVRPSQHSDTTATATTNTDDKESTTDQQDTSGNSSDIASFGEQRLSFIVTRPQRFSESLGFNLHPAPHSTTAATAKATAADSASSGNPSSVSSSEVCSGTLQLPHSEQQQQQATTPEHGSSSLSEASSTAVAPRAEDIVSGVREVQLTRGGTHCGTLKVLLELAPLRLLVGGNVLQEISFIHQMSYIVPTVNASTAMPHSYAAVQEH
jgi:hypothetical protein